MARSVNRVNLIGNTGAAPDMRTTHSGDRVAKVSLATSTRFKDRSGHEQERTQWHRLTFFGKLADVVEQWVDKGDRLYIEGRLEYSQTQADDGTTRYWTDIIVGEMIMLGSSGERRESRPADPQRATGPYSNQRNDDHTIDRSARSPSKPITEPDDDLPF